MLSLIRRISKTCHLKLSRASVTVKLYVQPGGNYGNTSILWSKWTWTSLLDRLCCVNIDWNLNSCVVVVLSGIFELNCPEWNLNSCLVVVLSGTFKLNYPEWNLNSCLPLFLSGIFEPNYSEWNLNYMLIYPEWNLNCPAWNFNSLFISTWTWKQSEWYLSWVEFSGVKWNSAELSGILYLNYSEWKLKI